MLARKAIERIVEAAALGGLFAFYVSMRPLGIHVSDSYAWVNTVDKEAYGFFLHPHHLMYLPLAWRWNHFVHLISPGVSTWASLAAMSAAFGCAGIAAVYETLRRLGARIRAACAGAALVAFMFGYWFFSSDAEVYVVSAACGLWAIYALASFTLGGQARAALWAGVAAGLAAVMHQTGIFLFVPAVLVFAAAGRGRFLRSAGAFTAAFAVVVAPCYLAAAWAVLPRFGLATFVNWLFLFAGEGYGGFALADTLRAPVGFGRAIVGGQMVLDALRGVCGIGAVLWAGVALAAGGFGMLAIFAVSAARRVRDLSRAAKVTCVALGTAFATYALFGTYFDAVNVEWWTIPVALVTVAAAIAGLCGARPAVGLAVAAAVLVGSANLALDFSYRRRPDCDFVRNAAEDIAAMTSAGDIVVAPSYLGVLIWQAAAGREVFCPDEARHLYGPQQVAAMLAAMEETPGACFIFAGDEGDYETHRFTEEMLDGVAGGDREAIGTIKFFDGRRRFVKTVSRVPVVGVKAQALLAARESRRLAQLSQAEAR
jgi:hypothetical protein